MKLIKYISQAIWLGAILPIAVLATPSEYQFKNPENGDVVEQLMLGWTYCVLRKDYYQALYWYKKAALQGSEYALERVADMYYEGECHLGGGKGEPNYYEALSWYGTLARKTKPEKLSRQYKAKLRITDIYFSGDGGIKAPKGFNARLIYDELASIPDSIIQKEKEENKKEYNKEYSDIQETRGKARYALSFLYYFGLTAPKDPTLAYKWAELALQDGIELAETVMAWIEYNGFGIVQNKTKAIERMRRLCENFGAQIYCQDYEGMKKGLPVG